MYIQGSGSKLIVIDLGCGAKKTDNHIGVDRLALPGVNILADFEEGLGFLSDSSVDLIYSEHLLEHIENIERLMMDIWRVLKPEGKAHFLVPHFSSPYYYSDYTHKRFFGLYTFLYFAKTQTLFKRKSLFYDLNFSFNIEEINLIFRSDWRFRRIFKRMIFQKIFNSSRWAQEFYEENLCYLVPCSEIKVILVPDK